ncbi:MAG: response regulator [Bacteroidia bacterium]|nr:response regulator [Bacteroidia bacterium]
MSSFFGKLFGGKKDVAPQSQTNVTAAPSFEPSADLRKVASLKEAVVLFVDDDPDLRIYIREELSEYFMTVLVARDGTDALDMLKANPAVDMIISDVMMPEMDGLTFCRTVKRNPETHDIAFILLTARADKKSEAAGYNDRADAFISKPFDIDDLIAKAQSLIVAAR